VRLAIAVVLIRDVQFRRALDRAEMVLATEGERSLPVVAVLL